MIAHEIAGSAFEALLVIEQDAAVAFQHEELCRTGMHTRGGGAAATHFTVDDDVCRVRDIEDDSVHTIIEGHRLIGNEQWFHRSVIRTFSTHRDRREPGLEV